MAKHYYKPKSKQKSLSNFYVLFIIVQVVIIIAIVCF